MLMAMDILKVHAGQVPKSLRPKSGLGKAKDSSPKSAPVNVKLHIAQQLKYGNIDGQPSRLE